MRSYIFTDAESTKLKAWLDGAGEDQTTLNLFVDIRRNLNNIKRDVDLLAKVSNRLSGEGRLMGRARMRKKTGT